MNTSRLVDPSQVNQCLTFLMLGLTGFRKRRETMARIPESELARLKREVSVERLAEARGVKLERHGADLHGLCPFHDDHEPSVVITPSKNLWHCLGACQAGAR